MVQERGYRPPRRSRQGAIIVILIFVMTLAATLFGLWARQVVREQHRIELQKYRLQATRLAEAGLRRLLARRATDHGLEKESWNIPADQLDNRNLAIVQLRV